ncbi:MAG TPA: HD domain-containing protein [Methanomicrobiales archaeon]|nr:HD domain-containing protein [Methanomicrobiales archaeon]
MNSDVSDSYQVKTELPSAYAELERHSMEVVQRLLADRPKASRMWRLLTMDPEVKGEWAMVNYVAVKKLGMNDHGEIHVKIASASALTMLTLLVERGVQPDVVASGIGDEDDAALVVLAAALCHDFGNQIHRTGHQDLGVVLAMPVLDRLLPLIYPDMEKLTRIRAFILSAIYTHHGEPVPLTLEAGLVCIGDSTDMTKGRGRMAFEAGSITIHTVSALSIENVSINRGKERPIQIRVEMSSSAGIFQVQEILGRKLATGPLADLVDLVAVVEPSLCGEEERKVYAIRMSGKTFVPISLEEEKQALPNEDPSSVGGGSSRGEE